MNSILAGATLDRQPGPKYVQDLQFAEISLSGPVPKLGTLKKWRAGLGDAFRLAWVAPRAAIFSEEGKLHEGEELDEATAWLTERVEALGAFALVLPTGGRLTPGKRDRDRLARFFAAFGEPNFELVWHPTGLWEPESALQFARRVGVQFTCDPLEYDLPPGSLSYARIRAIGGRSRLGDGLLFDVADQLSVIGTGQLHVAIASNRAHREALRLQQAMAIELAASR